MIKKLISILVLVSIFTFLSCDKSEKIQENLIPPSDTFSREFIKNVIGGNIDICLSMLLDNVNKKTAKQIFINTAKSYNSKKITAIKLLNIGAYDKTIEEIHKLTYEYTIENKIVLFEIQCLVDKNEYRIAGFSVRELENSLSEMGEFSLAGKTLKHFLFLFFVIIIPLLIVFTLVSIIRSKIKNKWLWLVIVLISVCNYKINWYTGESVFDIASLRLIGVWIVKESSISSWVVSVWFPVGAVLYWIGKWKNSN